MRDRIPKPFVCLWMLMAGWMMAAVPPAIAEDNPHVWKPRTKSVAVFKNQMGFFVQEGEVQLRDGWCLAEAVPPASFGAFAVYSLGEEERVDIVGSGAGEVIAFDDRDKPSDMATKRAQLEVWQGLVVTLTCQREGDERSVSGKMLEVGNDYAVLSGENTDFAVALAEITRGQVDGHGLRIHVEGAAAESSTLGMAYLRRGITWIPEYTLEVVDEETARLTLRGTLVNEAEDLIHTDVHFVVGAPHFAHSNSLSPLCAGRAIRELAANIAPNTSSNLSQILSNGSIQIQWEGAQEGDSPPEAFRPVSSVLSSLPRTDNSSETDYTVYTKRDLTVRQGARAMVTLFTITVSYEHIYKWRIPGDLKHYLRLRNATETAWTTGPCLSVRGDRPLGEDMLRYTPIGATMDLPIAVAVNIAYGHTEEEAGREFKAHTIHSTRHLDLVTLAGTLSLRNHESKAVNIEIEMADVSGKPARASDGGATRLHTDQLELSKLHGRINWAIAVKAGEEKTVTYSYERYVPTE